MVPSRPQRTRILIVDDSSFMRMAIRSILSKDPSLEIVGIAADGMEGVEKAVALKPDLITMDVEMPRRRPWSPYADRLVVARRAP